MIMRKILLNKSKGINNVNHVNIIPINFDRDYSLFHDEKMSETIDILKLYNKEKDECKNHRFVFTINPLCTNVLFNNITEIVYKEGSDECKVLNGELQFSSIGKNTPTRLEAIKNTEYSNDENLTYHCGSDIFNNHLLRKKEDIVISRFSGDLGKDTKFNTIDDFYRNYNGEVIQTNYPTSNDIFSLTSETKNNLSVYTYDTTYSFLESFKSNIKRENGWVGFYNPSTIHIPITGSVSSDTSYYVNKCINNREPCQFIDMAPERDLFYFTPKKNKNRHRIEHNWNYILTYPSECIYSDGKILNKDVKGLPIEFIKKYDSNNGIPLLLMCSPINHNLKSGDYVNILYKGKNGIWTTIPNCYVTRVGYFDNKNEKRFFSVREADLTFNNQELTISNWTEVRFVKVINGYECQYYFRKFKPFEEQPSYTINRLAFANTIYNDEVSQLVFTDSLNIEKYKDNLRRPLTEVYLTIIKNNKGFELWYNKNKYNDKNIEFSHVFGEVTSGIDIPSLNNEISDLKTSTEKNYFHNKILTLPIIRKQHNIKNGSEYKIGDEVIVNSSSTKIETGITIDKESFYGDLVEFDITTLTETILEPIKHRFNTAQRETTNELYTTITYDEIVSEAYDFNDKSGYTNSSAYTLNKGFANINPEGYIYNPHYKIKLGEFSDIVKQKTNTKLFIDKINKKEGVFTFKNNYDLLLNDKIIIFNTQNIPQFYTITGFTEENGVIVDREISDVNGIHKELGTDGSFVYKYNQDIPEYAYMMPDTTGRCLWKDITSPSAYSYNSDLYNIPFTNNAFYHHTNIIFPVKRQDPFNEYNLITEFLDKNNKFNISSKRFDSTIDEYVYKDYSGLCF